MRIINVKRAIIILLMIGIVAVVAGCARWPGEPGPEPEPGETEYQLTITVEINEDGVINSTDGIYYIVLDADGNLATEPGYDISLWDDDFYYVKLENSFFYFAKVEDESPELQLTDSSYSGDKLEVTIALSDLEYPNSIDINVVTTDSENETRDHLDSYFTINTDLGETEEGISSTGLEEEEADFDIVSVTAVITTLY